MPTCQRQRHTWSWFTCLGPSSPSDHPLPFCRQRGSSPDACLHGTCYRVVLPAGQGDTRWEGWRSQTRAPLCRPDFGGQRSACNRGEQRREGRGWRNEMLLRGPEISVSLPGGVRSARGGGEGGGGRAPLCCRVWSPSRRAAISIHRLAAELSQPSDPRDP